MWGKGESRCHLHISEKSSTVVHTVRTILKVEIYGA